MATFLYRMGRIAFRRRLLVTLLWAVILGAVGVGAATAPAASDDGKSFMPYGGCLGHSSPIAEVFHHPQLVEAVCLRALGEGDDVSRRNIAWHEDADGAFPSRHGDVIPSRCLFHCRRHRYAPVATPG